MRAVLIAFLGLVAVPAAAQPDRADELLDQASRRFTDEADYAGARALFEESYALRPSWRALNGIAATYQEEGLPVEALAAYERLLAEFGEALSAEQGARVRRRIDDLGKRIGVLELQVPQAGAVVEVNGEEVARGPTSLRLRRNPGPYAVEATLPRHHPFARSVVLRPGVPVALRLELVPETERVVVKVERPPLVRRMPRWIPWATLGGGAALAGIGGALSWSASSDFAAFDEGIEGAAGEIARPSEGDRDLRKGGERKQAIAIGLYAAGGAAAAAGLVLLLLNQPRPGRVEVTPAPGGLAVAFSF